jgi:hypothetical protein
MKKMRQNENLELGSDSFGTEKDLEHRTQKWGPVLGQIRRPKCRALRGWPAGDRLSPSKMHSHGLRGASERSETTEADRPLLCDRR